MMAYIITALLQDMRGGGHPRQPRAGAGAQGAFLTGRSSRGGGHLLKATNLALSKDLCDPGYRTVVCPDLDSSPRKSIILVSKGF